MNWDGVIDLSSSFQDPSGLKLIVLSTALKNPKLFTGRAENSHRYREKKWQMFNQYFAIHLPPSDTT